MAAIILRYPVHRHSTPPIASMTSSSRGDGFFSISAVAATSIPGVHAPHWAAPCSRKDRCNRRPASRCAKPSTVVTSHPSTCPADIRQAQTGSPSSNMVQAPQSPASHPTLVPVKPSSSRRTRDSRCDGELVTTTLRPFTRNAIDCASASGSNSRAVAISKNSYASIQSPLYRRQRSIHPVFSRRPYVINRGQAMEVFLPHSLPKPLANHRPDQLLLKLAQSSSHRRARSHRDPRISNPARIVHQNHRRDHRNRNHQISARSQLHKRRRRALYHPRHQHRRQQLVCPPLRLPVSHNKFSQRHAPRTRLRNQFYVRIQRQERRHAIRCRGSVAQITRHRTPILNLYRPHLARRSLQRIQTPGKRSADDFAPGRKPANSNPVRLCRNSTQLTKSRNIHHRAANRTVAECRIEIRPAR